MSTKITRRELLERLKKEDCPEEIRRFDQEAKRYGKDWMLGAPAISDTYFPDYIREMEEQDSKVNFNNWPYCYIDWSKAAEEAKQDYVAIDLCGEIYWVRYNP